MYADRTRRNTWHRNRRRQIAYGRWQPRQLVDPARAREHIAKLQTFGLSEATIALLAGSPTAGTLAPLTQPNHAEYVQAITPEREARILAVRFDLDKIPPGRHVAAAGTRRRIEALAYMGWSAQWIADQLGVTFQAVRNYAHPSKDTVKAETARKIRDLYLSHVMHPGPSLHARRWASANGWNGPLAWDDIDDPAERPNTGADSTTSPPDPVAVAELVAGTRIPGATWPEKRLAALELTERGHSSTNIAEHLGVSHRSVIRWRSQNTGRIAS